MSDDAVYDVTLVVQIDVDVELPLTRLEQAVIWVLQKHTVAPGAGVSIVIDSDAALRDLNRTYRGVDRPTDVLSFVADPSPVPDEAEVYLGDLILSLPYIQQQAEAEGHRWQDEITLAVVHGTLHLLGYDHDTPEHQARMWAIQAEALAALDVPIAVREFTFDDPEDEGE
jgi:probable rRNA maturation factor